MSIRTLRTMAFFEWPYVTNPKQYRPGVTVPLGVPVPRRGITGVRGGHGEELLSSIGRLAQESGLQMLLFDLEVAASYFCRCDVLLPSFSGWESLCQFWPPTLRSSFHNVQYRISYHTDEFCSMKAPMSHQSLQDCFSGCTEQHALDAIVYGFSEASFVGESVELVTILRPSCIQKIRVLNSVHPAAVRLGKLAIANSCWQG